MASAGGMQPCGFDTLPPARARCSNVFGMILGWLANWLAGTPRPLRHHVVAAAGFGNLNAMPLLIVSAICQHSSLPFQQSEQAADRQRVLPLVLTLSAAAAVVLGDQCTSVGFGYVAVGTAATQIFTCERPHAVWWRMRGARPPPSSMCLVQPCALQIPLRFGCSGNAASTRSRCPALWLRLCRPSTPGAYTSLRRCPPRRRPPWSLLTHATWRRSRRRVHGSRPIQLGDRRTCRVWAMAAAQQQQQQQPQQQRRRRQERPRGMPSRCCRSCSRSRLI